MSVAESFLLRAEIAWNDRRSVTRTAQLSPDRAVLPLVDPPPIGSAIVVRLSFPRLVEPFDVRGTVVEHEGSSGPGEISAAVVEFEAGDPGRARIAHLLEGPATSSAPGGRFRILIVEDNSMIRDMFAYGVHKYFGRREGVSVDVADDGEGAWRMLHEGGYDLAIIDHYLPVMHGAQLIARIREDERINTIPVVAISVGGEDVRDAAMRAGADLFLNKPIVLRDLFATLDRLTSVGAR
ncbi:MAG: response regulator [Polyangiales bacterium]